MLTDTNINIAVSCHQLDVNGKHFPWKPNSLQNQVNKNSSICTSMNCIKPGAYASIILTQQKDGYVSGHAPTIQKQQSKPPQFQLRYHYG